jgi:hypothetical protein
VCDTEITFHTKAESSEAIFSQLWCVLHNLF